MVVNIGKLNQHHGLHMGYFILIAEKRWDLTIKTIGSNDTTNGFAEDFLVKLRRFDQQCVWKYKGKMVMTTNHQKKIRHVDLLVQRYQWIGLRENLQETIDFPIKYWGFPVNFPLIQSIEHSIKTHGNLGWNQHTSKNNHGPTVWKPQIGDFTLKQKMMEGSSNEQLATTGNSCRTMENYGKSGILLVHFSNKM